MSVFLKSLFLSITLFAFSSVSIAECNFNCSFCNKFYCRCGGIGRRGGFKIHCSQGRAGSIPVIGT